MKIPYAIFTIGILLSNTFPVFAAIDTSKLLKVTPANNPKCVEYYSYKNEMYCSTVALSPQGYDPTIIKNEKQSIVFDNRAWQPAWSENNSSITTIEYVPAGDDINHWNELVTSQFIPDLQTKATLKEYLNKIIQGMQESGFKPLVTIHEDTPQQIIFEFRILEPENVIQDELQKLTVGSDGVYVLHYVIKKADMGQENRSKWLENLKKSSIK